MEPSAHARERGPSGEVGRRGSASTHARYAPPPTAADVFANLRGDLRACYEAGRRTAPTMTDGKVTLHASIDTSGRPTCVVPADDTGLTQEVENCMRERLEREAFARQPAPWSVAVPIVVRDAELALGRGRTSMSAIEAIESHGLAEDVYDVVESLLPELYACVHGMDRIDAPLLLYVGGRVGRDGQVACALASSPGVLPLEVRDCTEHVFLRARFRAPKKGYGLVSVPLNIVRKL